MKHPEQANPENNDRFKLTISDLNAPTKVHDDLHNDLGEFSEAQGDDEYLIQFNAIGSFKRNPVTQQIYLEDGPDMLGGVKITWGIFPSSWLSEPSLVDVEITVRARRAKIRKL